MKDLDLYIDQALAWLTMSYSPRPDRAVLADLFDDVDSPETAARLITALFGLSSAVLETSAQMLGVHPESVLQEVALRRRMRELQP